MTDDQNIAAPENAPLSEADTLRAADAWEESGFAIWEAVKVQIAAEIAEPTPFRADALARTLYEDYAQTPPTTSNFDKRMAHLEETQPDAMRRVRAEAGRLPTIDLTRHAPEADAIASLPADLARAHRALPVRKQGSKLWVAWEAMPSINAVEAVLMASHCQVILLVAAPLGAFADVLNAAYPPPAAKTESLTDANAELWTIVRELQNEVALLRQEVRALRKAAAKTTLPTPPVPQYSPPRRTSAPPHPLTPPADFWSFPMD